MFFFGSYLLDWAETQIPAGQIQVGKFATDSERIVRSLRQGLRVLNGSQETFGYFFVYQGLMVMIVLALAGSVIVGDDYNQGSLPFYLSKPIHRWHYLLGKMLAVGVVVNLLTTLPALGLFAQHGFDDLDYFFNRDYFQVTNSGPGPAGWPLLLGILGYGLLLTVFLSIVLVAVASWMRRTMPLILVWASLFLFLRLLANILVEGLQYNARWRLLDLWNSLSLLGRACLGFHHEQITPRPQPAFWEAALVLAGVVTLCLIYLNRRTRAVEIIR
jgi:ABC-2 type transport system permease protein